MRHLLPTFLCSALLMAGSFRTWADQTNLVQDVNINLTGLVQGGTATNGNVVTTSVNLVGIGTREVIRALGSATGNSFSRNSRLVLITPLAGGPLAFAVRDGTNSVDVSGFFVYQQLGSPLTSAVANLRSGRSTTTEYSLQQLSLTDSYVPIGLHFSLTGTAATTTTLPANGNLNNETDIQGVGSADKPGQYILLQGDIRIRGNTLEVVADSGSWDT